MLNKYLDEKKKVLVPVASCSGSPKLLSRIEPSNIKHQTECVRSERGENYGLRYKKSRHKSDIKMKTSNRVGKMEKFASRINWKIERQP